MWFAFFHPPRGFCSAEVTALAGIMRNIRGKKGFIVLPFFWSQEHSSLNRTHLICPCFFLAYIGIHLFCFNSVQPIPQCPVPQHSRSSQHTSTVLQQQKIGLFHIPKNCQREDSQLSWITSNQKKLE